MSNFIFSRNDAGSVTVAFVSDGNPVDLDGKTVKFALQGTTVDMTIDSDPSTGVATIQLPVATFSSLPVGLYDSRVTIAGSVPTLVATYINADQSTGDDGTYNNSIVIDVTSQLSIVSNEGGSGGVPGPAGPQGPQGPAGADGADGADGSQGPEGPQGPKGDTGDTGADSVVPGPQGPQGPEGPQGPAGNDSVVPGPQGPEGPEGPEGPQGLAGNDSVVPGPQGPEGPKGDDGDTGPQGPAGTNGTDGQDADLSSDDSVQDIRTMTQAAYDAITPVSTTLYVIVG